jgi:hypothetical protein
MDFTKIPIYLRYPAHFKAAENGSISYVPAAIQKMTLVLPGPIFVELGDTSNVVPSTEETNQ